jgi:hypothetical protein
VTAGIAATVGVTAAIVGTEETAAIEEIVATEAGGQVVPAGGRGVRVRDGTWWHPTQARPVETAGFLFCLQTGERAAS